MSMLNIGTSALLTTQGALTTTSHNISNVNTEGYSRQRVVQGTTPPNFSGGQYIGSGVKITSIERLFDKFLADQLRQFTSQEQNFKIFGTYAKQVDDMLGSPQLSIASGMESFFNAMQEVADDPTSIPARQVLLTEADSLARRFNTLNNQFDSINRLLNQNLEATVQDINTISQGIRELNQTILDAGSSVPNDLLDQRDRLINDLSKLVSVQAVQQSNGSINIFVGNGQGLVVGSTMNELTTAVDPADATRLDIVFGSSGTVVTNQIVGGTMGGLLTVRREIIDPARAEIDELAANIAEVLNQQHSTGLTLNGAAGGNLFAIPDPLPADWPAGAAEAIAVAIADPRDLAVAFPVAVTTNSLNSGSGGLTIASVDGSDPAFDASNALAGPLSFSFNQVTNEYTVNYNGNTATLLYNPAIDSGRSFDLSELTFAPTDEPPPLTITLTGVPADGDSFVINNSTGAAGDNRNALAMAELQVQKVLDGGTRSFADAYGNLVASVATKTRQAGLSQVTQQGLMEQTQARLEAVSGVNLDEEAANLIKYQQSYQAAAQIITVSRTIFDTLLNAF